MSLGAREDDLYLCSRWQDFQLLTFYCRAGEITQSKDMGVAHNLEGVVGFHGALVSAGEGQFHGGLGLAAWLTASGPKHQISFHFLYHSLLF